MSQGYGIARFKDSPVPVEPETLFYGASTTKSFTAAAISLLIDDDAGKRSDPGNEEPAEPLTWKTRISSVIPSDFVLSDPYATHHSTIEDALCHRTGMADHSKSYGPSTTSLADLVRMLRHLPLTSELREEYLYSNLMYATMSHVLETKTGRPMKDFLRERIWMPLGMKNTFFSLKDALAAEERGDAPLARGYAWDSESETYIEENLPDFPAVSGSGAIISNVLDYTKWLKCMMTRSPPLSPAGHAAVVKPRMVMGERGNDPFDPPNLYAMGWFVDSYRGTRIIWHSGGWTGFGSMMAFLPEKQWGFVMLGNTAYSSNYAQIPLYFHLLDEFLDTPLQERGDWAATAKGIFDARRQGFANPLQRLYPSCPANPLPPSLPLDHYAGSYSHPGYGEMNLVVDGADLVADRMKQEIAMKIRFQHVSGEFWLAALQIRLRDPRDVETVRAQFDVSVDGKARRLGVEFEPRMKGEKIWFERVE